MNTFLSGAAEDGKGSAAHPLTRRPDRLFSRRLSNLVIVACAAAVVGLVAAKLVFPSGARSQLSASPVSVALSPQAEATAVPSPTVASYEKGLGQGTLLEYSVALPDLRGLPLDTPEGTPLELWVAWDEAFADGPQLQKLVKDVSVARFIQPVTTQGPLTVVLSVPKGSMRAVMYGDLYGSFSVALPTG